MRTTVVVQNAYYPPSWSENAGLYVAGSLNPDKPMLLGATAIHNRIVDCFVDVISQQRDRRLGVTPSSRASHGVAPMMKWLRTELPNNLKQ